MLSLQNRIEDFIERNRVSTTEILDALEKNEEYFLEGLRPVNRGFHKVGLVHGITVFGESNYHIHKNLIAVSEGSIVYIECLRPFERAVFGSLVSKYLLLYKKVKAIVVNGYLRDVHTLIKENYPIWFIGPSPLGMFNKEGSEQSNRVLEGYLIVADDSGVVYIPPQKQTEEFLEQLKFIEQQEDKWFECIDNGWNTFETVCEKRYLHE